MKELDLLPFPELADRVVRPTLRCFVRMVWPIAVPMVALSIFMMGLQSTWLKAIEKGEFERGLGAGLAGLLVSLFFAFLWSMLCLWAISIAAVDVLAGRPASFWRSLRRIFEPRVFLTLMLSLLIHSVATLLCAVPLLFTLPLLFILVPLMIEEDLYGMAAIRRSIELTRFNATGRWADSGFIQASGLLFVGWGISAAIGMVVQLPLMLVQQYYIWNETLSGRQVDIVELTDRMSLIQIPAQMINVFAQLLGWFYWSIAAVALYREIRRRREGGDLEAAIPQILQRHDGG